MPAPRIIPCLDVKDGRVVKGVQFRDHRDVGDIVEHAMRYREEGADELVFYDISASAEARSLDPEWVRRIARVIDDVADVAMIAELDPLHHAAILDVEAGNDPTRRHARSPPPE